MLSLLAAWPSSLLGNDFIIEIGATYDIEMINGLGYLMEQGKLKEGDKIGHVYFEGEYGENGLKGSEAFAEENGMEVVEQKIKATDEDMSGQVSALKRAGVKAIAMTTAPDAAGVRGRHRRHAGPQRADRRQQPDVRPGAAQEPGGRGASRPTRTSWRPTATYNSDEPGPSEAAQALDEGVPRRDAEGGGAVRLGPGPGHERDPQEGVREQGPLARGHRQGVARSSRTSTWRV